MYTAIKQQISNHPHVTPTRMVETEIFFKKDRILLFCRCYYEDNNGTQIESIPERLYTFSTFGIMVNPGTGEIVHKDPLTGEYPVGSISHNDYLCLVPNTLPNSTTTYGNIALFTQAQVAAIDARGEFN